MLLSLHRGEVGLQALGLFRLFLPARRHSLPLGVKLDSTLAVEVAGAPHAVLVAGEGEHGQGNGDWEVDTNLSGLDFVNEFSGVSS